LYKIYQRDQVSSLKIDSPDNKSEPPKIMKKVKRKLKRD